LSTSRRNHFDLLRLVAALEVVLGHAVEFMELELSPPVEFVYTLLRWFPGVPIFFAISGYLLARSLDRNADMGNYMRNRALRIFPGLWLAFAGTAVLLVVAGLLSQLSGVKIFLFTLAQMTVGQFWAPGAIGEFGLGSPLTPNPALWTIRVEIGFYIALPFLILGGRRLFRSPRRHDLALVIIAVASFLIDAVNKGLAVEESSLSPLVRLVVESPAPHLWLFIAGVMVHRREAWFREVLVGHALRWLAIFLVARSAVWVVFEARGGSGEDLFWFPGALGVANLVLIMPSFAMAFSTAPFLARLRPTHDISYGVYVWHMVLVNSLIHWELAGGWTGVGIVFVGSIVIGYISWRLVERPALGLKRSGMAPVGAKAATEGPSVPGSADVSVPRMPLDGGRSTPAPATAPDESIAVKSSR